MSNPVDLSVEAALELEELSQKIRNDAPALAAFFDLLRSPAPAAFNTGERGICMLGDVRSYSLLKESLGEFRPQIKKSGFRELGTVIERYLRDLEKGVAAGDARTIDEAKRLCLALNASLVARQMNEINSRRERSNSQYISHESAS